VATRPAISPFNLADPQEAVADEVPSASLCNVAAVQRTYAHLEKRSNQLAHCLIDHGVRRGQHAGLYLQNSLEYVEATIAAYNVHAVHINVNWGASSPSPSTPTAWPRWPRTARAWAGPWPSARTTRTPWRRRHDSATSRRASETMWG
jgi:non-ribosomal peptide synthetase component F